jgi:mannose-6-phosphate isomerase-like protein (cupin superfamily)
MSDTFHTNIEKDTLENKNFRKVINTSCNMQLVLMSLKPREEIGYEVHNTIDQFFRIEQGQGLAIVENKENKTKKKIKITDGSVLVIPKGTYHNIINTSKTKELKLYSIYSPPNHPKGRLDKNKPTEDKEHQEGGSYFSKYLKYKEKYLDIKN